MSPRILSTSSSVFLKRFCWVAICASVIVLMLAGYVTFKLYERYVVRLAESNAVNIASSIVGVHRGELEEALNSAPLLPPKLMALDQMVKAFLEPYGIVKVKLFSIDGKIIYSNDMNIIGKDSSGNPHLEVALAGGESSLIQTKDQFRDLSHEDRFDVDVVESYVAMKTPDGAVIGVFEIYQDMTEFRGEVNQGVIFFVSGLALILLSVFLAAFWFMCRAADTMVAQQAKLEQLATIDTVTNVYNRAEITRRMEAEWNRYSRNPVAENAFGLIMLDLDHFKHINDRYGHLVGDELLKQVSWRLLSELRTYSDVGRYGGEEFIILLPAIGLQDLSSKAERIRRLISNTPFSIGGSELPISTSIGIAVASNDDASLDSVIKRADDFLYEAKERGRNCVVGAVLENSSNG